MGRLGKLGAAIVGEGAAKPIEAIGAALDGLFTSKEEKLNHEQAMARLAQEPARMQVAINMIEAKHRTVFVAGWRPFIGWICGAALGMEFVINPCIEWAVQRPGPDMDTALLLQLVLAMLGLAGMRSWEKSKGAAQ